MAEPTEPGELARALSDLHRHLERIEGHNPGWQAPSAGEQRWPVAVAVLVAVALQTALPDKLVIGPRILLPALETALLIGLVAANPRRIGRATRAIRGASITLIALSSLANGWSSAQLVNELVNGGKAGKSAGALLASGGSIYITNVIVFALWYWESDRGGPGQRAEGTSAYPDFLFPQMGQGGLAPADWKPTFVDYLYTSYTNATAFSPTDTMPLSHWAKMLMAVQSAISLATVALVVARAVNIFN